MGVSIAPRVSREREKKKKKKPPSWPFGIMAGLEGAPQHGTSDRFAGGILLLLLVGGGRGPLGRGVVVHLNVFVAGGRVLGLAGGLGGRGRDRQLGRGVFLRRRVLGELVHRAQ